jgi:predicted metalloprotease with PDZ domain
VLHYSVHISAPETHELQLCLQFEADTEVTVLRLPVWTPGSYMVREFSRYLSEVRATVDGRPVQVSKVAKAEWHIATPPGAQVQVEWSAYCHELTVRTPHVDHSHAFFTGTNVLLFIEGRLNEPALLRVHPPSGWQVFCSLPEEGQAWKARDYDELADTPVECGPHRHIDFHVLDIPHRLIFWGDHAVQFDDERLVRDVTACVMENARLFGGLPYERYDVIFHITDDLRGGLEHLSSTVLATPWRYFDTDHGWKEMISLMMHEHFHVWNIKRIRPSGVFPFDYTRENFTSALWIAEGFTSYYDDYHCLKAGIWGIDEYLKLQAENLEKILRTPGRLHQSIAGASLDAWIRLYRPDENTPNRTISYYLKGGIVAWLLDLTIRARTHGERSLDDFMKWLWQHHCETSGPFDEQRVPELMQQALGVDLSDVLQKWVFSTDDPDYQAVLATHGIEMSLTTESGLDFGWEIDLRPTIRLRHTSTGGPAMLAGLSPGDELVALDNRQLTAATAGARFERLHPDIPVTLHYFRRGVLSSTTLVPRPLVAPRVALSLSADADEQTRLLLSRWYTPPLNP